MKIRIRYEEMTDWLVYGAMLLFLSVNLLQTSFFFILVPPFILHACSVSAIGLLILREVLKDHVEIGSLYSLFIMVIMGALVSLSSGGLTNFVYTLIVIFFLRDFPFRKLAGFTIGFTALFLFITVVSSQLGIIRDYVEITATRTRHYLGFRYSLFPSTIMFNITALYVYLKGKDIKWSGIFMYFLAVFWIYRMTDSRLAFLSSCIMLLMGAFLKYIPNFLGKIRWLLLIFIPTYIYTPLFSYLIVSRYNYMGSLILYLDKFLGRRIYLANKSLVLYGYNWIGKRIAWVGNGLNTEGQRTANSYLYVDNLYIQVLQRYGIIYLVILCALLTLLLFYLYKQKQYTLMLILILLSFHAMIDDLIFHLHYNLFWAMLFIPFMSNKGYFTRDNNVEFSLDPD